MQNFVLEVDGRIGGSLRGNFPASSTRIQYNYNSLSNIVMDATQPFSVISSIKLLAYL